MLVSSARGVGREGATTYVIAPPPVALNVTGVMADPAVNTNGPDDGVTLMALATALAGDATVPSSMEPRTDSTTTIAEAT